MEHGCWRHAHLIPRVPRRRTVRAKTAWNHVLKTYGKFLSRQWFRLGELSGCISLHSDHLCGIVCMGVGCRQRCTFRKRMEILIVHRPGPRSTLRQRREVGLKPGCPACPPFLSSGVCGSHTWIWTETCLRSFARGRGRSPCVDRSRTRTASQLPGRSGLVAPRRLTFSCN